MILKNVGFLLWLHATKPIVFVFNEYIYCFHYKSLETRNKEMWQFYFRIKTENMKTEKFSEIKHVHMR
jgi:hypothetical protein